MIHLQRLFLAIALIAPLAGCLREPPPVFTLEEGKDAGATDAPMFGGTPQRNLVNTSDKNIPAKWSIEGKRQNIKWIAPLGNHAYGGPVIAGGKVFVGTNEKAEMSYEKAVLMAFNEADGKFLWKIAHEIPGEPISKDVRELGLLSTPCVDGKHLYYVTPGCEVVCASTDGKVKWNVDMLKEFKVHPFHCGNCSPLVVGDLVIVLTGNGRDEGGKVAAPKAPSFLALNKNTGKAAWQSNLPGDKIIEGQWSNPTVAVVNGKAQVIFPGGDCVLYSFDAESGKLIWKCDCNPTRTKAGPNNYIIGTPVVADNRLFIGLGVAPDVGPVPKSSYFLCIDVTKQGDVSFKSYDGKDAANKTSALVWAFGGPIDPVPAKGRKVYFASTISTAAVYDGLVYIPEQNGYMHCLDAKTGQRYWDHDFKAAVWGSPYAVDGRIYCGTDDGEVIVFAAGNKAKVIATNEMDGAIQTTPVVANGVLYVMTKSKLYAIK
jgi:outer membrane protein assembly factor BamB